MTHITWAPPDGNATPAALACDIRPCKDPAREWAHGRYCARHARMMAPRGRWEALGIPAAGQAA
jgi:hypothetical protein